MIIILIRVTLIVISIYFLLKYRQLSVELGFCDTWKSSNAIVDQRVEELVSLSNDAEDPNSFYSLLPIPTQCTPCPNYAFCEQGNLISCPQEFILTDSLLSFFPFSNILNGLPYAGPIAFPPRCEPDSDKRAMAADVAVHLLSTLEKHRGDVTCGNLKRKRGLSDIDAFSLSEVDVYAFISALKDKTISQDEFDDIYQLAVKDLVDNEEIDTVRRDNGINLLIARNAQISLGCRLRLKLSSIARKWRLEFCTLVALFLGYTFALTKIRRATAEKKRVKELVKYTIEHVRERMVESMHDPTMAPYVIPEQIRDNALSDIHSSAKRQKLWSRVRSVVESNANIQLKQLEIQGDITDVFEWKSS